MAASCSSAHLLPKPSYLGGDLLQSVMILLTNALGVLKVQNVRSVLRSTDTIYERRGWDPDGALGNWSDAGATGPKSRWGKASQPGDAGGAVISSKANRLPARRRRPIWHLVAKRSSRPSFDGVPSSRGNLGVPL
jgi:hypothetical protein